MKPVAISYEEAQLHQKMQTHNLFETNLIGVVGAVITPPYTLAAIKATSLAIGGGVALYRGYAWGRWQFAQRNRFNDPARMALLVAKNANDMTIATGAASMTAMVVTAAKSDHLLRDINSNPVTDVSLLCLALTSVGTWRAVRSRRYLTAALREHKRATAPTLG